MTLTDFGIVLSVTALAVAVVMVQGGMDRLTGATLGGRPEGGSWARTRCPGEAWRYGGVTTTRTPPRFPGRFTRPEMPDDRNAIL